jgi:hypothetical protein
MAKQTKGSTKKTKAKTTKSKKAVSNKLLESVRGGVLSSPEYKFKYK